MKVTNELCHHCGFDRPTRQSTRDGVEVIVCAFCDYVIRTVEQEPARHTAIRCAHATDRVREEVSKLLNQYIMPNSAYSRLSTEITMLVINIMWEHSEETATEYKQIIKTLKGGK